MVLVVGAADTPSADRAAVEFFEKKIRPVLADNCYQCHGPTKQKSNLRLDSAAAILKGGDRGPAVVARRPEMSPLVRAIGYGDENFQMPPKGKLKDEQIADLRAWV